MFATILEIMNIPFNNFFLSVEEKVNMCSSAYILVTYCINYLKMHVNVISLYVYYIGLISKVAFRDKF